MQGDLESRLRDAYRDGLGDAWDLCHEAADTLAAVREWVADHRSRWPGTDVESCAREVLGILDRGDTDE